MADIYDCIRGAALIVILVVLAFRHWRTCLWVDAVLCVFVAGALNIVLGFISSFTGRSIPGSMQSQMAFKFDSLHVFLSQLMGCFVIFPGVVWLLCYKSRDDLVAGSIITSRVLTVGLALLLHFIQYYRQSSLFTEMDASRFIPIRVLWFAFVAKQLYSHGLPAFRRGRKAPINLFLKIDFMVMSLIGLIDIFVPSFILNRQSMPLDAGHVCLLQTIGVLHVCSAFLTAFALGFRNNDDRRAVVFARFLTNLLSILCILCGYFFNSLFPKFGDLLLMMSGFSGAVVAGIGLYFTHERRITVSGTGYNLRSRRD